MKIPKTLICVFLVTFLLGYVFVTSTKREETVSFKTETKILKTLPRPAEQDSEPEVLQTIEDWKAEDESKFKIKLLETGEFHLEDISEVKTNETWIGLFKKGSYYSLLPTKIKVNKILNPDLFDMEVKINRKTTPVFLLKNADFLKQTTVKTIFHGEKGFGGEEDTDATFNFNGKNYSLRVEGRGENRFLGKGSKLLLSNGETTQEIRHLRHGCHDCYWHLYWVGDLDQDGKLDFYMNLSDHYNVIERVLFLSSQSEGNELVKAVALFKTVGC